MRRMIALAALLSLFVPFVQVHAEDTYADALYDASQGNLYNPGNAVGPSDWISADFNGDGTYLILDVGEGEEGTGNLHLIISYVQIGSTVNVEFQSAEHNTLSTYGGFINDEGSWIAPYSGEMPYRYVRIASTADEEWSLDAIDVTTTIVPLPEDEPAEGEDGPTGEIDDETLPIGALIKSVEFPSVYLLGSDGRRHAFPNETVFFSWDYSFDDVRTIASEELASYTLGGNVTMKPATHLVKLQTNPKVYAVAPGAELRWVTSESVATSLYGEDWADLVVDMNDAFWPNYTVGAGIDEIADIEDWEIDEIPY